MEKIDRREILEGHVKIFLKETQYLLDEKFVARPVKNICCPRVAIVESGGKCYVSVPFGVDFVGMLFETRDSFDALVALYKAKDAGGNASGTKE